MKILIVDDSNFSRKITSNLLKRNLSDLEVIYAIDGVDGINKYKEADPDYVFVDLLMPNLNGTDMIKQIKELDKKAKIIVITADVQKSVQEELGKYNIVSFINKPFNEEKADEICSIIRG